MRAATNSCSLGGLTGILHCSIVGMKQSGDMSGKVARYVIRGPLPPRSPVPALWENMRKGGVLVRGFVQVPQSAATLIKVQC